MRKMFVSKIKSRLGKNIGNLARLGTLLSALAIIVPSLPQASFATDLDSGSNAGETGRFFRMALNKSAIINLPGNAKDVIVGNNEVVDVVIRNKNTAYLFARKTGSTNVFFFDAHGQQLMALDLEVAMDTIALQKLIRRTLPGTHITVDVLGSNIILAGTAMNPLEAKTAEDLANQYIASATFFSAGGKIVNTVKIAGEDQVMLQVKVVEMQRDVMKQWGINLKSVLNTGAFALNLSNLNPFTNVDLSAGQGVGVTSGTATGNNFAGLIRAMEGDGMLHTLAEPNLTALSGQAASFKAGGEFPYQTCQISETATENSRNCEIKFKEYGIGLDFTPTVLSEGRINLKIQTSVSELTTPQSGTSGAGGTVSAGVPALIKRSANTVLEMPDGGSMMLAGLIRQSTRQNINGVPGLKNLPVLGALFRSRDFVSNQTELVVLVTPHIVRSVAQRKLQTPDTNFNVATDQQSFVMGRFNKLYGSAGKMPSGNYKGNIGFIVE